MQVRDVFGHVNPNATKANAYAGHLDDGSGVQHQVVVPEFMAGSKPVTISPSSPMPVETPSFTELLTALLVEQRITNVLLCQLVYTEVEPLETLRALYQSYPVTPS